MAIGTATAIALGLAGASGAGQVAGGIANGRANRDIATAANENDLKIAQMNDQRDRDLAGFGWSVEETQLDPFRHITSQANAARDLDKMAHGTPRRIELGGTPGDYRTYRPQITGGYEPSPEMRAAADVFRDQVLGGRAVAPDIRDPNAPRYGTVDAMTLTGRGGTPELNRGGQEGGTRYQGPGLGPPSAVNRPMAPPAAPLGGLPVGPQQAMEPLSLGAPSTARSGGMQAATPLSPGVAPVNGAPMAAAPDDSAFQEYLASLMGGDVSRTGPGSLPRRRRPRPRAGTNTKMGLGAPSSVLG